MTSEQKTVAIGAASGVASMAMLVVVLYYTLPMSALADDVLSRIIYALRMDLLALLPLFVMLIVVSNDRFLSKGINPLDHVEDQATEINGRVADNTLQQTFVFVVATLALSTFLSAVSIKLIAALTIVFVLARVAFWIGYRMHPLYRAPGMAATGYMNLGIILSLVYLTVLQINL